MNQTPQRGPIARFFIGLWDAMNFTRRLILNLLFFVLLFLLLAVMGSGDRTEPLLDRTTLVIAPTGALVEQYSVDPATRALTRALGEEAGEVQLRDLLRALDEAGQDETRHLAPIEEVIASGRTRAERLLDLYHGPWGGSVLPAFRDCVF